MSVAASLVESLRRRALQATELANATCGRGPALIVPTTKIAATECSLKFFAQPFIGFVEKCSAALMPTDRVSDGKKGRSR
jgi:hypothetical protein